MTSVLSIILLFIFFSTNVTGHLILRVLLSILGTYDIIGFMIQSLITNGSNRILPEFEGVEFQLQIFPIYCLFT